MPIGQVTGAHSIFSTDSSSSSSSSGSRVSRSILFMKVMIGVLRMRQTFEQLDGLLFDALGRVDHHQRRVDRGQHAVGVFREILVARRVEQVDHMLAVLELHHRAGDRDAALLFDLHPVGGRMAAALARLDGAGQLDRAGEQQQLFGQRGLAGVRVGDDAEGAAARHFARGVGARRDIGGDGLRHRAGVGKFGGVFVHGSSFKRIRPLAFKRQRVRPGLTLGLVGMHRHTGEGAEL